MKTIEELKEVETKRKLVIVGDKIGYLVSCGYLESKFIDYNNYKAFKDLDFELRNSPAFAKLAKYNPVKYKADKLELAEDRGLIEIVNNKDITIYGDID